MNDKVLCIYGASGVARECVEMTKDYRKIIMVDDIDHDRVVNGYPVYSFDYIKDNFAANECEFIVCVGEPRTRKLLHEKVEKTGYSFLPLLHDNYIPMEGTTIGQDSIVSFGSVLTCNIHVGEGCYINKGCIVGHDVQIGDYSVLSSGVKVGGFTQIGDCTYVGIGAVISDRVKIGDNCIVGAGAVVLKDVADNSVVVGNPARFLRFNKTGKVFK